MAEENFKVRKGLTVGSTITMDAASGDIVTSGDISADAIDFNSAEIGNVQIGVNDPNTIDTSTGNLILDSASGITQINDSVIVGVDLTVSGNIIKSSTLTAITLNGADVSIENDLTIKGNDIKSNGGTTAITLNTADVAVQGDLQVVGNDIKSSSGSTAITLSNDDVTIPGDINVANSRFTVTGGTETVRVNADNIEFYKSNASQKIMDIDALNSWDFYNDQYRFNYFNGDPLLELNGISQTAKFNFDNFEVWNTADTVQLLDIDSSGNVIVTGDLTVDTVKAPSASDLTLQGESVVLKTNSVGPNYDQLLKFNGTGYNFAASAGNINLLVTDIGTVNVGTTLKAYRWRGDTSAGSNQITNCEVFAINDFAFSTPLDWNTVLADITGVNAKPVLLGNSTSMFLPPNQGINFQVGTKIDVVTIDPFDNTEAVIDLIATDGATNANAANTINDAYGWFCEYTRNTDKTLVVGYNTWDNNTSTFITPAPGTALYTWNSIGAPSIIYPSTAVPYQATDYWSHGYSVAPTGSFIGRRLINLGTTNTVNENINSRFSLTVGANAVSTNRGLPNDPGDALGISVYNDGSTVGYNGKTAINVTQFKNNSFFQGSGVQERSGPYVTFNQLGNSFTSPGNTWNPVNNDGLGALTWWSRTNIAANLSSIFTPAGIWVKATQDWNNATTNSGAGMYLQYTPNSAGAQGGRTWAMATDVTTELRGGNVITLKPIAKSGSATNVGPIRGLDTPVNHTWLTAEDYVAGNAFTYGTGAKVTVGITNASGNNGDVGLLLRRDTGNTANFEWKLPSASSNTLQLVNNASSNVLASITDTNITTESDSYNFKTSSGTDSVTIDSSGNVVVTGDLTVNGNDIKSNGGTTAITLSNDDVTVVGDISTTNGRFSVTQGTETVRVNADNIEFYKSNATQKVMDIDALARWDFYNDQYHMNYFNGDPLVQFNGVTQTARLTFDNIEFYKTNNSQKLMDIDGLNRWDFYNDKYFMNYFNGDPLVMFDGTTQTLQFNFNDYDLKTTSGAAATSANINYTRTYGEFAYTAGTITIPAQNTVYTYPLDTTIANSNVTISGTGNININTPGFYKIIISLQAKMEVNSVGTFDFWLAKNGTAVPNSATVVNLLKDSAQVLAMDWLVESDGNDYWEIKYASSDTNYADIDFPTTPAWTTPGDPYDRPAAPALLVNVIPVGM